MSADRGPDRLLLADPDGPARGALDAVLGDAGYVVAETADAGGALALLRSFRPDVIVAELALPAAGGFDLVRSVRAESAVPIVVLSGEAGHEEKVAALDRGADDFVSRPFAQAELLARLRALLRRSRAAGGPAGLPRLPELEVDAARRVVRNRGRDVRLTPTEFGILEVLARSLGRPVSVAGLIGAVWNNAPGTSEDTVRVHVHALRRKIEPDPSRPRYIVTEPWSGYRLLPFAEPS